ncbi:cytochrome P450 [Falsiroseomonas sp.]|uniref:cytochrome P450 n=1 Tax=Falsiroseomonas sp. TaxID=2870721 RepID=UPI0027181B12|nr:cytochrome P450 [Falsiroseomonas sp.]MDO9502572.1 cytochrome P450 [Falsiroseomonas sp.]
MLIEPAAPPTASPPAAPYVPPFPPRPDKGLPLLQMLKVARENWLAIWAKSSFERDVYGSRLLMRDVVVCNSPDSVHYVFVERHENFQRKSPQHRHALTPLLGDGLFVSDGPLWRERRRVVAPVTHVSRLAELAPAITEAAAERREQWRALPPGPVDVLAEMGHLTAEIICRTIFGRALGRDAAGEVVAAFAEYQAHIGQTDLLSLFGLPDWFPRFRGRQVRDSARRIHKVVDGLIADILDGRQQGEASLIRAMSEAKVPGTDRPMDRRAFRNEAIVLFMAGHETTANTLAWALFMLSQDSTSAERLAAEVRGVLGERVATLADLPNLPFTRAVVEETLRLYPPVPLLSREALGPDRIGDRPVRKGTLILVSPWLLHRKPGLWDQPDAFIPDRFLPGAPKPPRHGYIPFSTGPRICTGQHLGLAEATICLAALAGHFRLSLEPGTQVMPVARLTLRPGETLPMRLTPR